MERLIIEYTVGDGYTYSAEVTQPLSYSSKQDAIDDFELLLLSRIDILDKHQNSKENDILHQSYHKNLEKLKEISFNKRLSSDSKEKQSKKILEDINKNREDINNFDNFIKKQYELEFGGQTFDLSNFIYINENTKKYQYSLPNLYTLDEFFFHVEKNLSEKNTSKLKIK